MLKTAILVNTSYKIFGKEFILKNKFYLIPVLLISFFIGCSGFESGEVLNLGVAKKSVQKYYESSNYEKNCKEVIDDAIKQIDKLILPEKPIAVFDIDETALSNYKYIKEIDFGYYYDIWVEWLKKSDAVVIPQTKRFYDYLVSKNVGIVFISGRDFNSYDATLKNLVEQGYTKFDTVIVRQDKERGLTAADFKLEKRKELVRKGFNIIANIGDQLSDFEGGHSGYVIKLPNYLYLID